jgi:succinate dehydrogenase / fumarate reductase cytochrome b subunit
MGWFLRTFNYSVGKKLLMALTGFFLILFLCIHLFGNSFLYLGRDAFNGYVKFLNESDLVYIVRVIEVILAVGFALHIWDGLRLWLQNRKARPVKYFVKATDPKSTWTSRNMIYSALIILVFLVIHLRNFWYEFKYGPKTENITDYDIVVKTFQDPTYMSLYVISMVFLFLHLHHGFQSAFQTLGINHKKYTPFIVWFGRFIAFFLAAGFASFPIYFFFFYGGN